MFFYFNQMNDAKITIILRKEAGITKKLLTNNYFSHLLGVFCKTDYQIIIFHICLEFSAKLIIFAPV